MSRPNSPLKSSLMDDGGSSSDEAELVGSPKRSKANIDDTILSGSVRSASYNIVFQVSLRIFTFLLNAFILRYVNHDVLGVCNVRLALLQSTVGFLSREPFRRACQRKRETDKWSETVNLLWFVVPNTGIWTVVFGYLWSNVWTRPSDAVTTDYVASIWLMCAALMVDAVCEIPFNIGQYFMYTKLRIISDSLLVGIRSMLLCFAVVFVPGKAVLFYAVGNLIAAIVCCGAYYGYFYYIIHVKPDRELPFTSIHEFLPNFKAFKVPRDLAKLTFSFLKQGFMKQLLTEGERYMMTVFDMLTFEEQGLYDLVSNLGSLAARFVFLPIEESSYAYFSQTMNRRPIFASWDKEASRHCAFVLGTLVRVMLLIGLIAVTYGLPYSNSVLHLYGGEKLSAATIATRLLQANCVYILVMAVNGVTETFTFAVMNQDQMDRFNTKLVMFSAVFLLASAVFVRMFGSVGFFIANGFNMSLRVYHSVELIKDVFSRCDFSPLEYWKLKRFVLFTFPTAFVLITLPQFVFQYGMVLHVAIGLVVFATNCAIIYAHEKDLLHFFVQMFKSKRS